MDEGGVRKSPTVISVGAWVSNTVPCKRVRGDGVVRCDLPFDGGVLRSLHQFDGADAVVAVGVALARGGEDSVVVGHQTPAPLACVVFVDFVVHVRTP